MAKKTQIQKFREAAREAGADESEERFNATLKDIAKTKRYAPAEKSDGSARDLGKNSTGRAAKPRP